MISHRLRAVVTGVPILAVSALIVVTPGFASESLVISSKLSGTTVSGELLVEGMSIGEGVELVTLALAPQSMVECGEPIAESVAVTDDNSFSGSLSTTTVPDGSYCVIAVADDGRLSTALGGVTVENSVELGDSLDGLQLPTESLDGAANATASSSFGTLATLGWVVLAATAGLALGVLALGFAARRRAGI